MMARIDRARYLGRPALTALILTLAACGAFGPDREPPKMPSPAHYAVKAQPAQLPLADGVAQQLETGTRPFPKWWTMYQSDALDALVDEGLAKSPSLAAAQSTLKAAREGLRSQIGQNMLPSVDVGFSPSRQRALGLPVLPQQTFIENIFAAEVQTSYTFDFFGAAVLADRALARQIQQQAYQLESTRRALAANIVVATINAASLQEQVTATEVAAGIADAGGCGAPCSSGVAGPYAGSGARALDLGRAASSGSCSGFGSVRSAASAARHSGSRGGRACDGRRGRCGHRGPISVPDAVGSVWARGFRLVDLHVARRGDLECRRVVDAAVIPRRCAGRSQASVRSDP